MYRFQICLHEVHAHGAIWKERGLLTSRNKDVKHAEEILQLLEAVNLLGQVAIMYCPGHQRDGSQTSQGNNTADKAARQAARELPCLGAWIPVWTYQGLKLIAQNEMRNRAMNGDSLTLIPIPYGSSTSMERSYFPRL